METKPELIVTPDIDAKMKALHRRLHREALGYEGNWLESKKSKDRKGWYAAQGSNEKAVALRREEFLQEVAARNPKIAALKESTIKLKAHLQREVELLEELLYTAALKEETKRDK